jgi:hypothetical protein
MIWRQAFSLAARCCDNRQLFDFLAIFGNDALCLETAFQEVVGELVFAALVVARVRTDLKLFVTLSKSTGHYA